MNHLTPKALEVLNKLRFNHTVSGIRKTDEGFYEILDETNHVVGICGENFLKAVLENFPSRDGDSKTTKTTKQVKPYVRTNTNNSSR